MDSSSFSHLPRALTLSFKECINTYNSEEVSADVKAQSLEKINALVQNVLKETPSSQEVAQEVKDFLNQIKVRSEDHDLCNQSMREITKVSPTIPVGPMALLPEELYLLIVEKLEKMEDIDSLAQTNHQLHILLSNPRRLTELLDKFSSQLSPEKKFLLALRCGAELTKLNLSGFQSLDDQKLKTLQKACPNLQSLNLSHLPILPDLFISDSLNLSSLHSFSKLTRCANFIRSA